MKNRLFHRLHLEACEPRRLLAGTVDAVGELAGTDDGTSVLGGPVASAAEFRSMDNLTSITTGILNFASARGRLPAHAIYSTSGEPLLSWRVSLLPYLGYVDLYNRFHLDEPWDSPHNRQLLKPMPSEFRAAPHESALESPSGVHGGNRLPGCGGTWHRFSSSRNWHPHRSRSRRSVQHGVRD